MMTWREELAWAAGFFDGEGCVSAVQPAEKFHRVAYATVTITQVDRRVLDRFRLAVGVGKVYGPYPQPRAHRQPQYRYVVQHHPKVQAVCAMLWTWLGTVKREQFSRVLAKARAGMIVREWCPHHVPRFSCPDCLREYNTGQRRIQRSRAKLTLVATQGA